MPKITLENGKTVEISQESYDALAKAVQEKRWKPESGDGYWFVSTHGIVLSAFYQGTSSDYFCYSQRNIFPTKEKAEKHLEYLKALAVLKDDVEDWEPDWSNTRSQLKWFVRYNYELDELETGRDLYVQYMNIYFETEAKAQHSIDTHRKEWLTVFGVER